MTFKAIVLDTETTGINKREPVEVAYFTFADQLLSLHHV